MAKNRQKLKQEMYDEAQEFYDYRKEQMEFKNLTLNKKYKNKKQKELFKLITDNRITFINGPAGTGKSIIALMAAIDMIRKNKYKVNKITLTKPIIEAAKSIGFLKGTVEDKTGPYFDSFYENIKKLVGKSGIKILKDNDLVDHIILNFIRGNTFGEYDENGKPIGYVTILDEAQNVTVGELKTFISRMGENTRLIILGDSDQCDMRLKDGEMNGLQWAFEYLQDIDGIAFFEFSDDDIVREPLLIEIMKRFRTFE